MKLPSMTLRGEEKLENLEPGTQRPNAVRTHSISECITNIAQWHFIELLKVGLMPLRVSNYFLIKSDELNGLFQKLDKNGIEQYKRR